MGIGFDAQGIVLEENNPNFSLLHGISNATALCFTKLTPAEIEQKDPPQKNLDLILSLKNLLVDENKSQNLNFMQQCAMVLHACNVKLFHDGEDIALACKTQGTPLVCQKGCTGCCHQMVMCTPFEAWIIKVFLEVNPALKENFANIWNDWDKNTKALRKSYMAWAKEFYAEGKDDGSHRVEDYYVACPFIDAQGLCQIYAVRPYACRTSVAVDIACVGNNQDLVHNRAGQKNIHYSLFTGHHKIRQRLMDMLTELADDMAEKNEILNNIPLNFQELRSLSKNAAMPEVIAKLLGLQCN